MGAGSQLAGAAARAYVLEFLRYLDLVRGKTERETGVHAKPCAAYSGGRRPALPSQPPSQSSQVKVLAAAGVASNAMLHKIAMAPRKLHRDNHSACLPRKSEIRTPDAREMLGTEGMAWACC